MTIRFTTQEDVPGACSVILDFQREKLAGITMRTRDRFPLVRSICVVCHKMRSPKIRPPPPLVAR